MNDEHEKRQLTAKLDRAAFDRQQQAADAIDALQVTHDRKQEEMKLESALRWAKLNTQSQDRDFVEYETKVLTLGPERVRAERKMQVVQVTVDQEIERADIEITRDRIRAEHAWEVDRLEQQAKITGLVIQNVTANQQPFESMRILQVASSDGNAASTGG